MLFADDAPDRMKDTIFFFNRIAECDDYELYVSGLVIEENKRRPSPDKE